MIFQPDHFISKLQVFRCASYADEAAQVQRLASGTRGIATIAPMKSYDRARAKVGLAVILWPGGTGYMWFNQQKQWFQQQQWCFQMIWATAMVLSDGNTMGLWRDVDVVATEPRLLGANNHFSQVKTIG